MKQTKQTKQTLNFEVYIPSNKYNIKKGYYNHAEILNLIRKHKIESNKIQFIADMLE